jgi:polyhydroxyalkanoate synthesis regulator protein
MIRSMRLLAVGTSYRAIDPLANLQADHIAFVIAKAKNGSDLTSAITHTLKY